MSDVRAIDTVRTLLNCMDVEQPANEWGSGFTADLAKLPLRTRMHAATANGISATLLTLNSIPGVSAASGMYTMGWAVVNMMLDAVIFDADENRGPMQLFKMLGLGAAAAFAPGWGNVLNAVAAASDTADVLNNVLPRPRAAQHPAQPSPHTRPTPVSDVNNERDRSKMVTGMVKWFNEAKGYGFITPDHGGEDIFVDVSAAGFSGPKTLQENQRVSFDVRIGPKGKQAFDVQVVTGHQRN